MIQEARKSNNSDSRITCKSRFKYLSVPIMPRKSLFVNMSLMPPKDPLISPLEAQRLSRQACLLALELGFVFSVNILQLLFILLLMGNDTGSSFTVMRSIFLISSMF